MCIDTGLRAVYFLCDVIPALVPMWVVFMWVGVICFDAGIEIVSAKCYFIA